MRLSVSSRLGPYEILAPLGAGGMGEVYRARDTRLDRIVALKILSEASAADPDRRERFEQEARVISALDHPHICPLYDVGDHGGTYFLVMPCLEGQTLADRLAAKSGAAQPAAQRIYIASDRRLMSVPINMSASFSSGVARPLFQTRVPFIGNPFRTHYEVNADSQRFLVNTPLDGGAPPSITLVLNWMSALAAK